jgi:hypothetical protein
MEANAEILPVDVVAEDQPVVYSVRRQVVDAVRVVVARIPSHQATMPALHLNESTTLQSVWHLSGPGELGPAAEVCIVSSPQAEDFAVSPAAFD